MGRILQTFVVSFQATCLFVLFFVSFSGEAKTTLKGYSDYFVDKTVSDDGNTIKVFAGATGNACEGNGTSPCDSCTSGKESASSVLNFDTDSNVVARACNEKQIYPDLAFSVTISSDAKEAYYDSCGSLIIGLAGTTPIYPDSQSTYSKQVGNQDVTATFSWKKICGNHSGTADSNCLKSFSAHSITFGFNKDCANSSHYEAGVRVEFNYRYVGVSAASTFGCSSTVKAKAYEAFCNFGMYPGDEKAWIYEVGAELSQSLKTPNFETADKAALDAFEPDGSGMLNNRVRTYYAEGSTIADLEKVTMASAHLDSEYKNGSLTNEFISGLKNGTQYVFLQASIDQGGNVTMFPYGSANKNNFKADGNGLALKPYGQVQSVIPQPVYGLLDGKKCFIATAAFNSNQNSHVVMLRKFRNQFLLSSEIGTEFTKMYYMISPPIAEFISKSEILKQIVRNFLWIPIAVVYLGYKIGFAHFFIMLGLLVLAFRFYFFFRIRTENVLTVADAQKNEYTA